MSTLDAPGSSDADNSVDQRASVNLLCMQCGYNLRGLPLDGVCPECANEVRLSIRGDFLRYANQKWLRQTRVRIDIVLWFIAVMLLVSVAGPHIALILSSSIFGSDLSYLGFLPFVYHGLITVALCLLTHREPHTATPEPQLSARRVCRLVAIMMLISTTLLWGAYIAMDFFLPPQWPLAVYSANWLLMFMGVCTAAKMIGDWMARAANRSAVVHAHLLIALMVLTLLTMLWGLSAMVFGGVSGTDQAEFIAFVLLCSVALLTSTALLIRARYAMATALAEAALIDAHAPRDSSSSAPAAVADEAH